MYFRESLRLLRSWYDMIPQLGGLEVAFLIGGVLLIVLTSRLLLKK
jgi:hypothetical protein